MFTKHIITEHDRKTQELANSLSLKFPSRNLRPWSQYDGGIFIMLKKVVYSMRDRKLTFGVSVLLLMSPACLAPAVSHWS